LAIIAVSVVFATFYFSSHPAPTRNGEKLIKPTKTQVHLIRKQDEVDGSLSITHVPSGDKFETDFYDKNHYEKPEQAGSPLWKRELSRDLYIIDPGIDLGTYGGVVTGGLRDDEDRMHVGLRFSPVRLLFGTTAPDLLVGPTEAGVGLSIYPPKGRFGDFWSHLGVGVGRTWTYDHGDQDNLVYLSFSTRN
jgi:hypothetical protein